MSDKRHIIGLSGPMGSGKTMVAKHLVETHDFVRVRFGDALKRMLKALGLTDAEVDGDYKNVPCSLLGYATPRHAMQTLGTEWGRHQIHPDLWVRALEHTLKGYAADDIVIDDVRFPNEVDMVRRLNGNVIRICREGHEPSEEHASEKGCECDYMLANNGTPEDLFDQIDHFIFFEEMGI